MILYVPIVMEKEKFPIPMENRKTANPVLGWELVSYAVQIFSRVLIVWDGVILRSLSPNPHRSQKYGSASFGLPVSFHFLDIIAGICVLLLGFQNDPCTL